MEQKETLLFQLIDDSLQEASEQFELELSLPSFGAKLGPANRATVIIDGPNDGKLISLPLMRDE